MVLALNVRPEETPQEMKAFAEQGNLKQIIVPGGASAARKYRVRSVPTTVIVNPKGQVVSFEVGFDPEDLPEIERRIQSVLPAA